MLNGQKMKNRAEIPGKLMGYHWTAFKLASLKAH